MKPRSIQEIETFFQGGERALKTYAETRKGVKMVGSRTLEECLGGLVIAKQISLEGAKPAPENKPIVVVFMGTYYRFPSASKPGEFYTISLDGQCNCPGYRARHSCRHSQSLKEAGFLK